MDISDPENIPNSLESEIIDFNTYPPKYLPVHLSLRVSTDFTHSQFQREIEDKISTIKKVTSEFLDLIAPMYPLSQAEDSKQVLQNQTESYASLVKIKFLIQNVQTTLRLASTALLDSRRAEEDVTLENYMTYYELNKEDFADGIVEMLKLQKYILDFERILKADSWYQYIRNAFFVLQHPEDPLPDDQADEELAMEGGKISLKDPLSLNYFVEPVMSVSCKHVYEKEHILRLMERQSDVQCPITGCDAKMTKKDLVPDLLMQLRIKAHEAKEKNKVQSRAARV